MRRRGEESSSTIMIWRRIKRRGWREVPREERGRRRGENPRKERRSWAVAHKSRVACSHRVLPSFFPCPPHRPSPPAMRPWALTATPLQLICRSKCSSDRAKWLLVSSVSSCKATKTRIPSYSCLSATDGDSAMDGGEDCAGAVCRIGLTDLTRSSLRWMGGLWVDGKTAVSE